MADTTLDYSDALRLTSDSTLEEVREVFKRDRFATEACKAQITFADKGHAICEMEIGPHLFNAAGSVQGGALFTLADFALAVACNVGEKQTVSVSHTIEFFRATKGTKLIAECREDKSGRTLGFYTVEIKDDLGVLIAKMMATCFR